MTEQERNLIRDAMMFAVKDITGRVLREATVQSMIDDFKKSINYTHCCKSDSELLPTKEKLNFEDWLKFRKIERINDDAFKWEGSKYTYYYVNDIYKQYLKN